MSTIRYGKALKKDLCQKYLRLRTPRLNRDSFNKKTHQKHHFSTNNIKYDITFSE